MTSAAMNLRVRRMGAGSSIAHAVPARPRPVCAAFARGADAPPTRLRPLRCGPLREGLRIQRRAAMLPKTILVPTDLSLHAETAFEYACELAVKLDATIHL